MPRLIYWNVQVFSEDKFFIRKHKRRSDDDEEWGGNAAQSYLDVLFNTITANNPQFIVIVEARPGGNTGGGTLLTDAGAVRLLCYLRNNHNAAWAMVPPVISGGGNAGEGVVVYFRRSPTLFFTGPWRWPGGRGSAVPAVPGGARLYPAPYNTAFSRPVDNRTVPAGNYNVGQVERMLAGQWRYVVGGGGGGGGGGVPPAPINFGGIGTRSPFRVTFYDTVAARNYSILACHITPSQDGGGAGVAAAPSTLATAAVGNLHEVQNIGANETIVVVGDFNVSLFEPAATGVAYVPFANAGYTKVINWLPGHPMPAGYPSRGYLITHIKKSSEATPSWTYGYPAFGYTSEHDWRGQYDSIDNAFVRQGAVGSATIANIVSGAPYTVPRPDVPTGTLNYNTALQNPLALNVPNGYNPYGATFDAETELFQDIDNYVRAHNVSDHLPLVFDF
jgi:hypothetical protein